MHVSVIIPAHNEERSIGLVVSEIPRDVADDIIVVCNACTDATEAVAREAGARTVLEARPGYGRACLAGMAALGPTDIVVFLDGDHSDYPEEMRALVAPIIADRADLVIGSRALGTRERGSMTPQQIFGNLLATNLIRLLWGFRYTDLGPFRAVRARSLYRLGMADQDYGWTVEMQIKALLHGLRVREASVNYRMRIGTSKISGTLSGTVNAGKKILWTIFRHGVWARWWS